MSRSDALPQDPRGLIAEAYRMEVGPEDCRSIFFDWALGEAGDTLREKLDILVAYYEPRHPDHPMTAVLREGRERAVPPGGRRGGRAGRLRPDDDSR
ncbi:hypothetical protein [Pontivivens ytuae]|uniref:Uncharacterized protein n=1 Tax=Pontivivens ytuae TaxID=2789856 RepID=A0A7S9LR80_9RHOB|nr:hypothetical protein [Pontivivens ytuae]QPH53636.1 hypothetical protein I0K15_17930 [Pontivivens ytuae]